MLEHPYSTPPRVSSADKSIATPSTVDSMGTCDLSPRLERRSSSERRSSGMGSAPSITLLTSNSIGSLWTVEMTTLRQAGSYFEAVECLRRIRSLLADVDKADRVKFCQADYDSATKALRKQKLIWSPNLYKEVVSVTVDYFDMNHFKMLPTSVFIEVLHYVPVEEFLPILLVCSTWLDVATSNETWCSLYRRKFLNNNPMHCTLPERGECVMFAYHRRLMDPMIGDKVEVAWRGKFRLETSDVYQGLAWWVAEIVDKHPAQERYKIRYPGWESRWDEWVPRSRLRWTVQRNTLVNIQVGDVVELWCCGANVPGAWLESKVKRIRGERYCLGRVLSTGFLWVERERIRLVRRKEDIDDGSGVGPRPAPRRSLSGAIASLSRRFSNGRSSSRHQSGCTVM